MTTFSEVKNKFEEFSSQIPYAIGVSGRANMIGEHTDYNEGFVFPFAIDKKIYFAAQLAVGNFMHIYSLDFNEMYISGDVYQKGTWQYFFKETYFLLTSKYGPLVPITLVFGGDLPIGSGISSSSALCCGFIKLFDHFNNLSLSQIDIVNLASEIEHGSGVNGGKMDQYTIVFGEESQSIFLDCKSLQHVEVRLPKEWNFFLLHSGVKHNLVHTEYNTRRAQCESAVEKLKLHFPNIHSLRDVNLEVLNAFNHLLTESELNRAKFVIEENIRVHLFRDAIINNDIETAGKLLNLSHDGLSRLYEVSCAELDYLHFLAQSVSEIQGSRMMGGGFGGCTINLANTDLSLENIEKKIMVPFQNIYGRKPVLISLNASKGIKEYQM